MKDLVIAPSEDTPGVVLTSSGNFEFTGRSLPEDVTAFYSNIIDWINQYFKESNQSVVSFNLEYFNTASSKILLDIFLLLEEKSREGKNISVKWYCRDTDEDMQDAGEEYSELADIPFEIIKSTV